jgi:uroporphyrinogen decarboxylase
MNESKGMTPRQRLLAAIERRPTDRLPVTTHHLMPYFLDRYMDGASVQEFFEFFGIDAVRWIIPVKPDESRGERFVPGQAAPGFLQTAKIESDRWLISSAPLPNADYATTRYTITTPKGVLSSVIQGNGYTEWVGEHLLKDKKDLDLIAEFMTHPLCDAEAVSRAAEDYGERGIVRSFVLPFDFFGQPGCWQDFCCIRGTERAIMDCFDDPAWVHEALSVLRDRKLAYVRSLAGAPYDLMELGGGDGSTTVISPSIFREFVAPYDTALISAAREAGIRIVYHTCGGMMPILEDIADMGPAAMETFTPEEMGADVDLREAKRRIGERVCMIGGFNQAHYLKGCAPEETRAYVRRCFEDAGAGGGYILAPSDHFFDADPELLKAFADEARRCEY